MWHLEKPDQKTLDDYAKMLLPALKQRIEVSELEDRIKGILLSNQDGRTRDETRLKDLLTSEPQSLFDLSEQLMAQIIFGYNIDELEEAKIAMNVSTPSAAQIDLKNKYSVLKLLENTFGFNAALSSSKSRSYALTAAGKHNTCVYCNRQYAFNIVRDGGKNDKDRIARPALDHWFPKSLFPLMSLSYYNLIPSCTVCNSSAKLDRLWKLSTHIHPYTTASDEPAFKFRYKAGINATWEIDFDNLNDIEKKTIEDLCLKEAYQSHSGLEVSDLIELASKNNGTYLKQVYVQILHLYADGTDKMKAYRLLFGAELMPRDYKNRPMSKLKRDIIEQIERAQGLKIID